MYSCTRVNDLTGNIVNYVLSDDGVNVAAFSNFDDLIASVKY